LSLSEHKLAQTSQKNREKAKTAIDKAEDVQLDDIQVCEVCGYTLEGEAPDKCPVCNAPKNKFKKY
jgi:rubrerythrin